MRLLVILLGLVIVGYHDNVFAQRKTENVILITFDGLRWQEVFQGADSAFFRQQKNLKDPQLKEKFWRDDVTERRKALLPFFWNTIAVHGQLYGNRLMNSPVAVSNRMWFSYPGYNEILTGNPDDARINSNDKNYNPNITVLEFLNKQPAYRNKVAAFTSWDCFPYIINDKRSGVYVNSALVTINQAQKGSREELLNQIMTAVPNPLYDVRLDAFTFYYGMEYVKKNKPRVLYFAFDETDDFAHAGEYAAYLNAAHYTDRFIGELWNYLQSDPFYKGKTTIIITTDHGRGRDSENWKHHGIRIEGADEIWMAVLGPDTKPLGEMRDTPVIYQKQTAATVAALLGLKFPETEPSTEAVQRALTAR